MRKKLLSALLCLTLCAALFPAALAEEGWPDRWIELTREPSYPLGLMGMEEHFYDNSGNRVETRTLLPMEYSNIICVSQEPQRYLTQRPVGDEGGSIYRYGLVDDQRQFLLPEEYTDCAHGWGSEQELLAFRDREGKYAYYSIGQGRFVTDFAYDTAEAFQEVGIVGVHVTYGENGLPDRTLYGAVNAEGELIVPLEYSVLGRSAYGDFLNACKGWAYTDGPDPAVRMGAIDYSGKPILACVYPNSQLLSAALCMDMPLRASGEAKLKEEDLSITWLPQYSWVEYVAEDERLLYRIGTEGGIARLDGTDITGPVYHYGPTYFHDGTSWQAYNYDTDEWIYLDPNGNVLPEKPAEKPPVSYLYDKNYGFLLTNEKGNPLFPKVEGAYYDVPPWDAGEGLYGFVRGGKVGFANAAGKVVIEPKYDYSLYHSAGFDYCFCVNGLAPIYQEGGGRGFIDTHGNWYSRWDMGVLSADEGPNGKYGYRDENWNLVVPYLFDNVGEFKKGYALVRKDGVYGLLKDPTAQDAETPTPAPPHNETVATPLASLTQAEGYTVDQLLEAPSATVVLRYRDVPAVGGEAAYRDYDLYLVSKDADEKEPVKRLLLPSTTLVGDYAPTDRGPDSTQLSSDGFTFAYVYSFDSPLVRSNGEVLHEAGTYWYDVEVSTGKLVRVTHTDDVPTPPTASQPPAVPGADGFTDVASSDWFAPYVDLVREKGVMIGTSDTTFSPQTELTQAECLTLALRLYDLRRGGDGVLEKAPEAWGKCTLALSDDATWVHWGEHIQNPTFDRSGYLNGKNQAPRYYVLVPGETLKERDAWAKVHEGRATLTYEETAYPGKVVSGNAGSQEPCLIFYPDEAASLDNADFFADTRPGPDKWYRDAAYTAEKWGLTEANGFSSMLTMLRDGDMWADRRQFAQALSVAAGELEALNTVEKLPDLEREFALDIYRLYEAGVLTGKDPYGTFDGNGTLTRAEAAAMAARVIDKSLRVKFELLKPSSYDKAGAELRGGLGG